MCFFFTRSILFIEVQFPNNIILDSFVEHWDSEFLQIYSIKGYHNGCSLLCYTTYPFAYLFFLKFEYSCITVCVSLCYAAEGTSHTGTHIPSLGIASPLRSPRSSEGFLCRRGVLTRYLLYTQQCVYASIYSSPHPSIPSLVSI